MTTEIREKVQVEIAREIDLEELGQLIGVPIKVRPWWGSHRGYKYFRFSSGRADEITPWYRKWQCPTTGGDYYAPTAPRVEGKAIVVYVGRCGVKWGKRTHKHSQWVNILSVEPGASLVEVFAGSDRYSHSRRFILGVDGKRPYVAQVGRVSSLHEAFEFLKPPMVIRAEQNGLEVKRQGDWFFVPRNNPPNPSDREFAIGPRRGKALYAFPYPPRPTRHYAEEIMQSSYCTHAVRGRVASPHHGTLVLEGWHTAIRNRAIRPGGNGAD